MIRVWGFFVDSLKLVFFKENQREVEGMCNRDAINHMVDRKPYKTIVCVRRMERNDQAGRRPTF